MARILVVDDDELPTPFVAALIEKRRASVQSTDSGEAGIELATGREFDPAIANLMTPGTEGLETISRIRPHKADIKIPPSPAPETATAITRVMRERRLAKPFDLVEFLDMMAGLVMSPDPGLPALNSVCRSSLNRDRESRMEVPRKTKTWEPNLSTFALQGSKGGIHGTYSGHARRSASAFP